MGQNFSSEPVVDKETERAENGMFKVAVSSCQGWRMSQEDNHSLMLELPQSEHKASFFAVYDGHGSARISKHASESLWRHLTSNPLYIKGNFKEALEQAFLTFDEEVNQSQQAQMAGTTAICVLIVDNVIYCANIGDSRAVASINCACEPLSHDHKPDNPEELKRILKAGGYVLGNRVNGNLALSRAFGDFHYKSNAELAPEDQIVSPRPDVKRIELNEDVDFLVLACDGIWDVLTSEEVVNFVISRLEQNMEPGLICEQLTTRCLATDYELVIGCDNMTVLLVCHTRGRSWADYCTNIFEKNTKRLGVPRTRSFNPADLEDDTDVHRRRQHQEDEEERNASIFLQGSSARSDSGDQDESFTSHLPRDIRFLLDAIQNLHSDDDGPAESSGQSRITEVSDSNAEEETGSRSEDIDDDNTKEGATVGPTTSRASDQEAAQSSAAEADELGETVSGKDGRDGASKEEKTTELYLGSPDDVVNVKGGLDGAESKSDELVTNVVEIELGAPDDGAAQDAVSDSADSSQQQQQQQQQEESGESAGGDAEGASEAPASGQDGSGETNGE